jgi:hypothetical protein
VFALKYIFFFILNLLLYFCYGLQFADNDYLFVLLAGNLPPPALLCLMLNYDLIFGCNMKRKN